jgi:hypothetical protein
VLPKIEMLDDRRGLPWPRHAFRHGAIPLFGLHRFQQPLATGLLQSGTDLEGGDLASLGHSGCSAPL